MIYAQLNEENICIGISQLSGKVAAENMIELASYDTGILGKKYVDGKWEDVEHQEENGEITAEYEKSPQAEPTEQELIQAEILLNQSEIIAKQKEHDEVLAELLLGQQEVQADV